MKKSSRKSERHRPGPSRRLSRDKKIPLTSSKSTGSIERNFKSELLARLNTSRSKSAAQFREVMKDIGNYIQYNSVEEVRNALVEHPEGTKLLNNEEFMLLLADIDRDLSGEAAARDDSLLDLDTPDEDESDDDAGDLSSARTINVVCYLCRERKVDGDGNICPECIAKENVERDQEAGDA